MRYQLAFIVDSKILIFASSYNTNVRDKDPTAHAEINAIRKPAF